MEQTLAALATYLKGRLIGDGTILIRDISTLDIARDGDLIFAESAQHLTQALGSSASAILVGPQVTELTGRSGISVHDPKLAFALLLELFHPTAVAKGSLHPTAVIGKGAGIAEQVEVRAHAVIGERVRIGRGTLIEPGACIGDGSVIGEGCFIGPNVSIYRETLIGHRVRIHGGAVIGGDGFGYVFYEGRYVKVPQVGNVVIEDDVEIGSNTCVDRATIGSTLIRRGTKIDNLVQIAHNDQIGQHVVMAGQVGLSGSVTVGDYTRFGGKAGVVDHVTIGPQAEIGAASVVTKSVPAKGRVWGFPARPAREVMIQMGLMRRLPKLTRTIGGLLRRLVQAERRIQQLEERRGS